MIGKIFFFLGLSPFALLSQNCAIKGSIAGHTGKSEITTNELATVKDLELSSTCGAESAYKVVSYDMTFVIKGNPILLKGKGSKLEAEHFKNLTADRKLCFDNIKLVGPNGVKKTAEPVYLTVKK